MGAAYNKRKMKDWSRSWKLGHSLTTLIAPSIVSFYILKQKIEQHHTHIFPHFHGRKDKLVPFENLSYAKQHFSNCEFKEVIFEEENHFIPWTQQDTITATLLKL